MDQTSSPKLESKSELVIGWCDGGQTSAWFTHALAQTLLYDVYQHEGGPIIHPLFSRMNGGPLIARLRNGLVQNFLRSDVPWLLMVDSDMVWEADMPHKLLSHADPVERPIVTGLTMGLNVDGEMIPTMGFLADEESGEVLAATPNEPDQMLQIDVCGAAFLLVHRSVFERMADELPNPSFPWFGEDTVGRTLHGEDYSFCLRAKSLGIPVHVDTGVAIGHHKAVIVLPSFPEKES